MSAKFRQYGTSKINKNELQQLVELSIAGDKRALNDLCEKISTSILFKLKKIVGNNEVAEDISQEVLIKVCRGIKNLKDPKAFNGWLAKIISNEKNQYFSKHLYHEPVLDIEDYKEHITEEKAYCIPSEWLDKKELCVVVSSVVSDLPERQREAVMLHYYDELSVTETAEVMGVAVANVSTYIANACRKLKIRLEGEHTSEMSRGAYTAGAVIGVVLQQEGVLFAAMNEPFIQTAATACAEVILSETAIVAASTAVASTVASTVAASTIATSTEASTTAVTSVVAAAEGTFATLKIIAACTAITIATTCAAVFGAAQLQPPEAPYVPVSPNDFHVSFYGGTDWGENIIHVEPDYARINAATHLTDHVKVEFWWITEAESGKVLYEGNSDSIGEILVSLREEGITGEHVINYKVSGPNGYTFTINRNFYMPEHMTEHMPEVQKLSD